MIVFAISAGGGGVCGVCVCVGGGQKVSTVLLEGDNVDYIIDIYHSLYSRIFDVNDIFTRCIIGNQHVLLTAVANVRKCKQTLHTKVNTTHSL